MIAPHSPERRAFTLIELLVVLAIILLLSGLIFASVRTARQKADRTVAMQNMRTIGLAISNYAADQDATLPGPLWPGQMPLFDPTRTGRLVREIAVYLPIAIPTVPTLEPLFVPPAYLRQQGQDALATARTYVMNMAVIDDGQTINPWGSLAGGSATPLRLGNVPAAVWGFSDADQEHPRIAGASWANDTPKKPVHGSSRLAWFFDGHVSPIEPEALR